MGQPGNLDAVASACAFLSNLLLRPEAGAAVTASLTPELASAWPLAHDPETTRGVEALLRALAAPASPDELKADYRALFVGPGPMRAVPFESVHRGEEGLTFDVQTIEVRRAYAEFGRRAPRLHREPDDHIGLELAFVGELAAAGLEAIEAGDAAALASATGGARRFVDEHLLAWGPGFARLVAEGADTDLYRAVGHLLTGALPQLDGLLAEG